jgi:hypothetical protein
VSASAGFETPGAVALALEDKLATARIASRAGLARPVLIGLVIFLASRAVVLLVAEAVTWVRPESTVRGLLGSWDGGWYNWIAADGYPDHLNAESNGIGNRWAFAPGLPLLIRVVNLTGLSLATSGLVVSFLAGVAMTVGIARLCTDRFGEETAVVSVSLVCFYPAAYVFSMTYTEPLFLACAAWSLWAAGRDRWALAGVLASASCVVRNTGIALAVAIGIMALMAAWQRREARLVAAAVLAGVGQALWMAYQWWRVGTPMAAFEGTRLWYHKFVWFRTPFESLWQVVTERRAWSDAQDILAALGLMIVATAATLAIRNVRRREAAVPWEWWLYSAGATLFAFSPYWPGSILRYTLAAFPLLPVAAHRLPGWLVIAVVGVSATTMGLFGFAAFYGAVDYVNAPFSP